MGRRYKNADEAAKDKGHDYTPAKQTKPTRYRPGTIGKLDEMRRRYEVGEHIWSDQDPVDCTGVEQGEQLPRRGFEHAVLHYKQPVSFFEPDEDDEYPY